jgi:acyl-CoA synthetase (AMP-forming)/AMP-acid ligase II
MYLTQTLHNALQRDPDRVMAASPSGRTRTVAETVDRVSRLAGGFRSLGIAVGDTIAIWGINSGRYHESLLAVPWAGAVLNPVNTRWNINEVAYSLKESQAKAILVDNTFSALASELMARCPDLRIVISLSDGSRPSDFVAYEELIETSEALPDERRGGADILGVFYTGGTTGLPKGVLLSHNNVLTSSMGSLASGHFLTPDGTLLHSAPLFHLGGFGAWTAGMIVGSTHVFLPSFSPDGVFTAVSRFKITDALLVPTMLRMLLDAPTFPNADLSSLRSILYSGSHMPRALLDEIQRDFPAVRLTQAYGMTELGPVATLLSPQDHEDDRVRESAGRVAPHAEIRVVDLDGREVGVRDLGEVVVRGDNVMTGYLDRPEETAAAIRDGWLHTGDIGYLDERGYLFVVDRLKDMIITGGENVYSAEVENALTQSPAVSQCAVIAMPHPTWGETVHAVVVLRPGFEVVDEDLKTWCQSLIAGYKVPRSFSYVAELPLSAAGKVSKVELRRIYQPLSQSTVSPSISTNRQGA